nr:unnamed protein product [Callosobruchus analis]
MFSFNLSIDEQMVPYFGRHSVVTVASNVYDVDPVQNVKRYDRKEAKNINIPQPHVIAHDNGVANYRCQVFGKKWWWPLFSNSLDSLVVNAWKLYNLVNEKNISQLHFKSYIALRLLKTDKTLIQRNLAPAIDKVRYDDQGHLMIPHANKARRRCRICHSHTIYIFKNLWVIKLDKDKGFNLNFENLSRNQQTIV